mmetsp:Transcript_24420/g.36565  ORF Transcript_24420/g.36565 Transcript_24420/m.36565 type:complete len:405 (-) Transcript_24420:153-1367(-)
MTQMTSKDRALISAIPGNSHCADCNSPHPTWASVSMGTLICLECSGTHRSLGVHISFVRSVTMDSWSPQQLKIMKAGGNTKCKSYLKQNGIGPNLAISAKYNSPVAQEYKEKLKKEALGAEYVAPRSAPAPAASMYSSVSSNGSGSGQDFSRGDPNGMERLTGESDAEYIQRQARLKEAARARMAAKFGGGGGMGGVGSDKSYNPNSGYGNSAGGIDMDNLANTFSSAISTLGYYGSSAAQFAGQKAQEASRKTQAAVNNPDDISRQASRLWGSLSSAVANLAQPDDEDGLEGLRHKMQQERGTGTSRYDGFGSDKYSSNGVGTASGAADNPWNNGPGGGVVDDYSFANSKPQYSTPVPAPAPVPVRAPAVTHASSPVKPVMSATKLPKPSAKSSDDFFAEFGA